MNGYKLFPVFLVVFILLVPIAIALPQGEYVVGGSGNIGGDTGGGGGTKANGESCSAASECSGGYCNSNVCASSAPSGGGAAPSGGGAAATTTSAAATTTTTVVTESKTISTIAANSSGTVKITKTSDLKIEQLVINVKNAVVDVQITVKESSAASLPSGASAPVAADKGAVLKYLEITKANVSDTDIKNVTIQFIVEKSWAESNNIDVSTVALQRLVGTTWTKLKTTLKGENSTVYKFEAESPGLSFFTITGEKKVTPPTACPTCSPPSAWSECINNKQTRTNYRCSADTGYACQSYAEEQSCQAAQPEKPAVKIPTSVWITFGVIAVAAVVYFLYKRKIFKF